VRREFAATHVDDPAGPGDLHRRLTMLGFSPVFHQ
jgi:hypothetical protein